MQLVNTTVATADAEEEPARPRLRPDEATSIARAYLGSLASLDHCERPGAALPGAPPGIRDT
eukprot:SAG31_NODE_11729_length_1002_cov_2.264673_1_plen_61_part_10